MNTSHLIILLRVTPATEPHFINTYLQRRKGIFHHSLGPLWLDTVGGGEASKHIYVHGGAIMISVKLIKENFFLDGKPILWTTVNFFFSIS